MVRIFSGILFLLGIMLLVGCIKDAPINPEADIETIKVPANQITAQPVIDQSNKKIILYLTAHTK